MEKQMTEFATVVQQELFPRFVIAQRGKAAAQRNCAHARAYRSLINRFVEHFIHTNSTF